MKRIRSHINLSALQEVLKEMGVNFVMPSTAGVLLSVGLHSKRLLVAAVLMTFIGCFSIFLGIKKRNRS